MTFCRRQMLARMHGRRVAEELVYGADEVTSGASSDIVQATRLAQTWSRWGFCEVGVVYHSGRWVPDHCLARNKLHRSGGEALHGRPDAKILTDHRDELDRVAHRLSQGKLYRARVERSDWDGRYRSTEAPLVPEVSIAAEASGGGRRPPPVMGGGAPSP